MSSTKSIAVIIIILVASGAGYALVYLPLSNENTSLIEEIANQNSQNENLLQDYEALQQDYEISSSDIEDLNEITTSLSQELEDQNLVNELLSIENDSSVDAKTARDGMKIRGYLETSVDDFKHTIPLLKRAGVDKSFDFKY